MEAPEKTIFCFTDGPSCITDPGPCGAGSVIFPADGHEEIQLKRKIPPKEIQSS